MSPPPQDYYGRRFRPPSALCNNPNGPTTATLEGLRAVQPGESAQLELELAAPVAPAATVSPVLKSPKANLDGLTYPQAVLECFRQVGRPMKASEVANRLHHLGYRGERDRKRVKNNVDAAFRQLRIDKKLERHPLGYALAREE